EDTLLATAYSLESVLIELIFIVGPMLVALFVATASPAAAVLFAAASGCVGTLLFLRAPPLRSWRIEPRSAAGVLGPLGQPGFVVLIAIILCYSTAFGLLEIGMTAYATEKGNAALGRRAARFDERWQRARWRSLWKPKLALTSDAVVCADARLHGHGAHGAGIALDTVAVRLLVALRRRRSASALLC